MNNVESVLILVYSGEEELKQAISKNESKEEVATLTHELSVVKAAIADKSRQVSIILELDKI